MWSASEEAQEENVHMLHGERSVTMWGPDEEQTECRVDDGFVHRKNVNGKAFRRPFRLRR